MSGIYLHIPFCKKKCNYCDFHFSTQLKNKWLLVESLAKEIEMRKNEVVGSLQSIYFGGGTPSLLNQDEWQLLFNTIHKKFSLASSPEITVEVNPDDITKETMKFYLSLGINRLSIGIQSFNNADLQFMHRIHTGNEAENSIKLAQDGGLKNISIDLIYGSPTTSNEMWKTTIDKVVSLNIPHISAYALTVEPKTELYHQIQTKKIEPLDEKKSFEQFSMLQEILPANGFTHYEISNFAKENFTSLHNSNYWKNNAYLGIGPSAHSYDGENTRSWNVSNNSMYMKNINDGILPSKKEILTEKDKYNEWIMTGLRRTKGIDLAHLFNHFDKKFLKHFEKESQPMIKTNQLIQNENFISINPNQLFFSDGIIANLFFG